MSATIAAPQKQLVQRLLKSGRFNNASEIIRHGLELVRREVEREELSPHSDSALAEAYRKAPREERELDSKLGRACARPSPGELD
jgi:Arc/MetJ-type ribon-helix-helix transcriptional regulator